MSEGYCFTVGNLRQVEGFDDELGINIVYLLTNYNWADDIRADQIIPNTYLGSTVSNRENNNVESFI